MRRGPISVTYCPSDDAGGGDAPVLAGFAIGRKTGSAVVRNRIRRRLRAVMQANEGAMAPGAYLLGAGAGARHLAGAELEQQLIPLLMEVGRRSEAQST